MGATDVAATTIRVTLPADVVAPLQMLADAAGGTLSLETVASRKLAAAVKLLPAAGRVVVVSGAALEGLEAILGGGSVLNEADLLKKVERLAGIAVGHVRLPFTPAQLEQLADRAARQGLTVEQLFERAAPRIHEQFFNIVQF